MTTAYRYIEKTVDRKDKFKQNEVEIQIRISF